MVTLYVGRPPKDLEGLFQITDFPSSLLMGASRLLLAFGHMSCASAVQTRIKKHPETVPAFSFLLRHDTLGSVGQTPRTAAGSWAPHILQSHSATWISSSRSLF